jgi:hypothetical protein
VLILAIGLPQLNPTQQIDRRGDAGSESISGMSLVRFLNAVRKHWWKLMGCAAFTLLGILVLYANKSNHWALLATFGLAAFCLLWACFLAWRDEERKVIDLTAKLQALEAAPRVPAIGNIYFQAPPVAAMPEPLKHNVKCVGVEIPPDFPLVLMCFRNIEIPGKPVGRFKSARLKVTFYLESSGEQVEEIFPARWSGFPDQDEIEVGVKKACAVLAMHSLNSDIGWEAHSTKGIPAEIGLKYILERTFLPSARLKIVANLIGENNISLDKPIKGILALGEDRSASWTPTE